jgi:hypothetical protein
VRGSASLSDLVGITVVSPLRSHAAGRNRAVVVARGVLGHPHVRHHTVEIDWGPALLSLGGLRFAHWPGVVIRADPYIRQVRIIITFNLKHIILPAPPRTFGITVAMQSDKTARSQRLSARGGRLLR